MPWDPHPGTQIAPQVSYRARMPTPPSKGGMQPRFFAPQPRWSEHLLGIAVPKPRQVARLPAALSIGRQPRQLRIELSLSASSP